MSTKSNFHFDQPVIEKKDPRTEFISRKYGSKTDRELLEEQTHLAQVAANNSKSIKGMISFLAWIIALGIVASVVLALISIK